MNHIDLDGIRIKSGGGSGDDLCVIWQGYVERNGYGKSGHEWVHRRALSRKLGRPVAPGMDACHTCDVRLCVNPAHLYEGTRRQNMADMTARGRHNKPRGEAHWRARLTTAQVVAMRARRAAGETTVALGAAFGVHPATVSRIVRGVWRTEVPA